MATSETYRQQVALLLKTIPIVAIEPCFALKGGTAINLFVRNMPRVSVDIDLTYIPVQNRDRSLAEIDAALHRIADEILRRLPGSHVQPGKLRGENSLTKLIVKQNFVQIKIEVTPVLRGCVHEPQVRAVSRKVEQQFGFAEIQTVSFSDLFAGKIVAALDRQHPRDLFDLRELLASEGIDDELRGTLIVYVLSSNRSISELLEPQRLDLHQEFMRGFEGMTETSVTIDDLNNTRELLISEVIGKMPSGHRDFLLSFKRGKPQWELLNLPGVEHLPAIKWRLHNLDKLAAPKRAALVSKLARALGLE